MEELSEEGRIACECLARRVERRGCRRRTLKGFADEVVFTGDTRQDSRRLLCWSSGAVRQGGWRGRRGNRAFDEEAWEQSGFSKQIACSGRGDRQKVFPS